MHACIIESFGGPEVLVPQEVCAPVERQGWVSVELRASALNWHDVLVRRGMYGSPLPHIIGADGAGVRRDTGDEVVILPSMWWGEDERSPSANWEILGDTSRGTYAEVVSVPTESAVPKPKGLDWGEAAAFPLVGLTAFRALFSRGGLRSGEHVLVLGASGGLQTMAVMLARAAGAHAVVTSSTQTNVEQSVELGAAGGVLYTDPGWPEHAKMLTPHATGFDLVFDAAGSTWPESLKTLRPGGRLVSMGATAGEKAVIAVRPFYFGQYSILGTTMGSSYDFVGLMELMKESGPIAPPIHGTWPLDEAAAAHEGIESSDHYGKLLLAIS